MLSNYNKLLRNNHRLLRWSVSLARPCPVYTTTTSRPWRRLDATTFRDAVSSSSLSRPEWWASLDADDLARLYDSEITAIRDRLVPARTVRCQRRASDPWFDYDCRAAKCSIRIFERRARRAVASDSAASIAAWRERRRAYRALLKSKRDSFWQSKLIAESASPQRYGDQSTS